MKRGLIDERGKNRENAPSNCHLPLWERTLDAVAALDRDPANCDGCCRRMVQIGDLSRRKAEEAEFDVDKFLRVQIS